MHTLVLGVSSSIAAYKVIDLIRILKKKRLEVYVIMTEHATQMISPLEFEKISDHKVYTTLFPKDFDYKEVLKNREVEHIKLAAMADLIIIAPATANIIGKIASGIADDFVTTIVLATQAPVLVCPSMNTNMWQSSVVQENIGKLQKRNFHILPPANGRLACGKKGPGRLVDIEVIHEKIKEIIGQKKRLKGQKIMITAGGTQESIDAVRIITSRASGKMGRALAEQAFKSGAEVLLLRAESSVSSSYPIKEKIFKTGQDLFNLVKKYAKDYHVIFHTAAVSDFRPEKKFDKKLASDKSITIKLRPAVKIISYIKKWNPKTKLIGFKAVYKEKEEDLIKIGIQKLKESKSDFVIVNDVGREGIGFAADDNEVYIISPEGLVAKIDKAPKPEIAKKILSLITTSEPPSGGVRWQANPEFVEGLAMTPPR